MDDNIPGEVRTFIRERLNSLTNASDSTSVTLPLSDMVELFLCGSLPPERVSLAKRSMLKAEFVKNHFLRFTEFILSPSILVHYSRFTEEQRKRLFDVFFLRGPSHDSLLVLGDSLSKQTNLKNTKLVVSLLEKFCSEGRFVDLIVKQCQVSRLTKTEQQLNSTSQIESKWWSQLITLVVSLPGRVANKMKLKCVSKFYPDSYFKMLTLEIIKAFEELHDNLSMSCDCSLKFLGELVGRICMAGQADKVFAILLPSLEKWLGTSPLWSMMCNQLITAVPDTAMESVAEGLLRNTKNPTVIAKLFGELVITSSKFKYLMTTKFLLMRSYSNINILHNIIGYVSGCKQRDLLVDMVHTLFDVWSRKSAIKHTTYDQHFYITCAVILSFGHLNSEEIQTHKHTILTKLLVGVQNHLDSPQNKLQRLGMVVAECVTTVLEPERSTIEFDYVDDEETKLLRALVKGPRESASIIKSKAPHKSDEKLEEEAKCRLGETANTDLPFPGDNSPLDVPQVGSDGSDEDSDGFIPYNLDDEVDTESERKSPKHLRDCIEGLVEADDPSKTEASLVAVQKLVCAELDDLEDVCVELVKVLLHLEDRYSTEMFSELRHNAMVSVAVRCPKEIANYLTEEFFASNYNLQQRMDMLNVLVDSALQLSAPTQITREKLLPRKFALLQSDSLSLNKLVPEWQIIVQERINAKTKRLSKGPSCPSPKTIANKFSGVAGFFFFPLMKNFDCRMNTLDLLGDDSLVLGRLVYTLGIVMYSARETPVARNMGPALLEFTWCLKYHKEAFVRQAVIFAQAMVVVAVPSSLLMAEASKELFELHDWLKLTVASDVDRECVKAALQTILLLEDVFKSQVALFQN